MITLNTSDYLSVGSGTWLFVGTIADIGDSLIGLSDGMELIRIVSIFEYNMFDVVRRVCEIGSVLGVHGMVVVGCEYTSVIELDNNWYH